ncbi:MAG: ATP-grasp domain-containing protein [Clostridiales bacterium]|nr:ATP-grasp domain-containing protein [Clostridiales bacterium]
MKKRILILGAGNAQIDAIEYCKAHGYEVVGCSYTTVDCGIPHLDIFEQVDIKSIEGVTALAEKYGVSAIYSVGSDLAMPVVMKVSADLGLPHFISAEAAETCHSKGKMREALGAGFEGNAAFMVCSTLEEALEYTDFPAMMKPVDSQGQRGCFKVMSSEDIKLHFAASLDYSFEGQVIIEQYIDGPEVSVNAYMQDGVMKFALVSDRYAFDDLPGGIIKEHRVPSSFADEEAKAKTVDLAARVAEKIGISNGPFYCQIKLMGGTEPVIIEVTPRLDGCHMWNLIKHYCGADLLDACFRHLLEGDSVLDGKYDMPREEYSLEFMSKAPNTSFSKADFDTDGSEHVCYYYKDGDRVLKINGYIEKCGYVIRRTGRVI